MKLTDRQQFILMFIIAIGFGLRMGYNESVRKTHMETCEKTYVIHRSGYGVGQIGGIYLTCEHYTPYPQ